MFRPSFARNHLTLREQRAQGTPGARCTRGLVCKCAQEHAHEHTGSAEAIRHSLRNGFTAYLVLSPVSRALLPPSPARLSANLTPASGCQDHTTSPSASAPFVFWRIRVHRIPSRGRGRSRLAPLLGRDGYSYRVICISEKQKYFCEGGWTRLANQCMGRFARRVVIAPADVAGTPSRTASVTNRQGFPTERMKRAQM